MIAAVYSNIEKINENKETRIRKIKKEYREWVKIWKNNYIELVSGLNIYTDKMIEWDKKDQDMKKAYEDLIKKLRKHMKKLEV
jgi:uncharacterized protein YukE